MAVQRQGIALFEPDVGDAKAGQVGEHGDLIAAEITGGDGLVHAGALHGRERLYLHAARFHQALAFCGAEDLEFCGILFVFSHGQYPLPLPILPRWAFISCS